MFNDRVGCGTGNYFLLDDITITTEPYVTFTTVGLADYRFGFNGMEQDDEVKGIGNSVNFGARIYDSRLGRWMSIDSYFKDYPYASPYSFGSNKPIVMIDPSGGKNVIYLYFMGNSDAELSKEDMAGIKQQIEGTMLHEMGIEVEVVVYNDLRGTFDRDNLDPSDVVVAVGSKSEVAEFAKQQDVYRDELKEAAYSSWDEWVYNAKSPEHSERMDPQGNPGQIVGVSEDLVKGGNENKVEDFVFVTIHGIGHNVGFEHVDQPEEYNADPNDKPIGQSAETAEVMTEYLLSKPCDYIESPGTKNAAKFFKTKFEEGSPQDNYEVNKEINSWFEPDEYKY